MDNQEQRAREIFVEAVALPPAQWPAFLDRHCETPALRARVQSLLEHHQRAGEFLSKPASELFTQAVGPIGPQLAEFRIIREIGRGGMGTVYLAEDTILRRPVALKALATAAGLADPASERFRKEAQAVARLSHPGIVQVYRFGEDRGVAFIAMEYVEGGTLREFLAKQPSAPLSSHAHATPSALGGAPDITQAVPERVRLRDAARIVSEVAHALDHAHRHGVIHRDVKPSNILIDRDEHARLTDFGIARLIDERTLTVEQSLIAGSIPYMSPEQARLRTQQVDHRSDVFSLGVVLYELLARRRPFEGDTPEAVFHSLTQGRPLPLRQRNPAVPRDLATICHKAIELSPRDRYQTAAHMAADLRSFLAGDPILARPPSPLRLSRRWMHRHRGRVGGAVAAALCVSVVALIALLQARHDRSLAWISLADAPPGCELRIQRLDPVTFELLPTERAEALRPSRRFALDAGRYRLTVLRPRDPHAPDFAETDLLLTALGPSRAVELHVLEADAPMPAGPWISVRLTPAAPRDDAEMVLIEAGPYDFGAQAVDSPLLRRRVVTLPAFYIDTTEVSNAEYLRFLYDTAPDSAARLRLDSIVAQRDLDAPNDPSPRNHHPNTPDFWKRVGYDPSLTDRPVVGVRLADAEAYARWAGKRLPTMFEWEAAARGRVAGVSGAADDDLTHTGDDPSAEHLRLSQSRRLDDHIRIYAELSRPVDAPDPHRTPSNILHMFDNAREITSTVDLTHLDGVAKGRCWLDFPSASRLSDAWTFPLNERFFDRGFRCARSAAPAP